MRMTKSEGKSNCELGSWNFSESWCLELSFRRSSVRNEHPHESNRSDNQSDNDRGIEQTKFSFLFARQRGDGRGDESSFGPINNFLHSCEEA